MKSMSGRNSNGIHSGMIHPFNLRFGGMLHFDMFFGPYPIAFLMKKHTKTAFSIAACPTRFLIIVFRCGAGCRMKNVAHIGFIHAHSKGIGAHHDPHFVFYPFLLFLGAFLIGQSTVIVMRGNAFILQPYRGFLNGFSSWGKDNRTPFCVFQGL